MEKYLSSFHKVCVIQGVSIILFLQERKLRQQRSCDRIFQGHRTYEQPRQSWNPYVSASRVLSIAHFSTAAEFLCNKVAVK